MPECVYIIPKARIVRIAKLSDSAPDWEKHLGLLSAEGCLCIMQDEDPLPDRYYAILLNYPNCFKSFSGDLSYTDSEVRLITKDTGYVFSIAEREMTDEKEASIRSQLEMLIEKLENEA